MLTGTGDEWAFVLGSLPGLGTRLLGAEAVGAPGSLQGNTHTKGCFTSCSYNLLLECFFLLLFYFFLRPKAWCDALQVLKVLTSLYWVVWGCVSMGRIKCGVVITSRHVFLADGEHLREQEN